MISVSKTATAVLEKQDQCELSPRILELREKIQDKSYLDSAIQRIAQVVSRRLVEEPDSVFMQTGFNMSDYRQGDLKNGQKQ